MSWLDSIKYIINTSEVCDFYTNDEQKISFNKHGTLCFNRGGMWHPDDEIENRYKRVDLNIIIQKLANAGLEHIIKQWTAFSMHNWLFLEYLDRLDMLDKITYLAYSDPHISLPLKYIKKMTALRILIIDPSKTSVYDKPTGKEQKVYQAGLAELVNQLPPTLEILFIHFPLFNGTLANLPIGLRILCIISYQFNQSLDYLPLSLEVLLLLQHSTFQHNILNLPPLLKMLALDLNGCAYKGSIQLPPLLEYLQLTMRSNESFLAAVGEPDFEHILNLKTLICDAKWFSKIQQTQKTIPKLKDTNSIHYTNLIKEFLDL